MEYIVIKLYRMNTIVLLNNYVIENAIYLPIMNIVFKKCNHQQQRVPLH